MQVKGAYEVIFGRSGVPTLGPHTYGTLHSALLSRSATAMGAQLPPSERGETRVP